MDSLQNLSPDSVTVYTVHELRSRLIRAAGDVCDLIRDMENSDATPADAVATINAILARINA